MELIIAKQATIASSTMNIMLLKAISSEIRHCLASIIYFFSSRITQGCVDDSGNHLSPGRVRTLAEKIKNKTFVCWFVSFLCAAEIVI